MSKVTRKPYNGRRKATERVVDTALYILTLIFIVALTASVREIEHDLKEVNSKIDELSGQIDTLSERIEEQEFTVYEASLVLDDKPEYHIEATWPELYTEEDVIVLTKMLYGEARGVSPMTVNGKTVSTKCQQAAVIWTALNRYDAGYSDSISKLVKAPLQFVGYRDSNPVDEELMDLVKDVLDRWNCEKHGETDVGRVLPSDYLWFSGDRQHNYFRNKYEGGSRWMWELTDVYGG